MEKKLTVKKGRVSQDEKEYNDNKKVTELLSSSLSDIKEKFKNSSFNKKNIIENSDDIFEEYKKKYKESLEIVFPKITPIGMGIITTASLMNILDNGQYLINSEFNANLLSSFKEAVNDEQTVVAIGPSCRQLKVGDKVKIRFEDFSRVRNPNSVNSKEVTEVPLEVINNIKYLSMHEGNIKYIIQE